MRLASQIPNEKQWKHGYRLFSNGKLPPRQELIDLAKIGAKVAKHYRTHTNLPAYRRREKILKIHKKVNRIADAKVRELPASWSHQRRRAYKLWIRGYSLYQVYRYEEARGYFEKALTHLQDNPIFLLDYGRLQYNTGWYNQAEYLFRGALLHIDEIEIERQPFQIIRWLSKTARIKRDFQLELQWLLYLVEVINDFWNLPQPTPPDIEVSTAFVIRRLARSYLDIGLPDEAWTVVEVSLQKADNDDARLLVAQHAVEALIRRGKDEHASKVAEKWAKKLSNPAPLARYLRCTDRPFSASRTYIRLAEEEAQKVTSSASETTVYLNQDMSEANVHSTPPKSLVYWKYAQSAFDNGLPEEGIELACRASSIALEEGASIFIATILQTVSNVRKTVSNAKRVRDLYVEAKQTFPNDILIQLQYGYHLLHQGEGTEAVTQMKRAIELSRDSDLLDKKSVKAYLATAHAYAGDIEKALSIWKDALPKCDANYAPSAYRWAVEWAVESNRPASALGWTEEFLNGEGDASWTTKPVRSILESGGRAALQLGKNGKAATLYERLVTNHAHFVTDKQEDLDPSALKVQARPMLMAAIAHGLAGKLEESRKRVELARELDSDHELIAVAESVGALTEGNPTKALQILSQGVPPEWLLSALGPVVAGAAEGAGASDEELRSFRLEVKKAQGALPSPEEILAEKQEIVQSLEDAQQEAEAAVQARKALQESIDSLVDDMAAENERLRQLAQRAQQKVVEAENRLHIELAKIPADGNIPEESLRSRAQLIENAFPNITFRGNTLEKVAAMRGRNQRSVSRVLGIAQYSPGDLPIRRDTVDLGEDGTAYEVGFPGKGNDPGRLYFTGGGTRWTLEIVGFKSTQKKDIKNLKS